MTVCRSFRVQPKPQEPLMLMLPCNGALHNPHDKRSCGKLYRKSKGSPKMQPPQLHTAHLQHRVSADMCCAYNYQATMLLGLRAVRRAPTAGMRKDDSRVKSPSPPPHIKPLLGAGPPLIYTGPPIPHAYWHRLFFTFSRVSAIFVSDLI